MKLKQILLSVVAILSFGGAATVSAVIEPLPSDALPNLDSVFQKPTSGVSSNGNPLPTNNAEFSSSSPEKPNDKLVVTPNAKQQSGFIWSKYKLDFSNPFHMTYYLNLGDNINGADGMTFLLKSEKNEEQWASGQNGGGLQAYNLIKPANGAYNDLRTPGINNTVGVEFDTYYNNSGDEHFDAAIGDIGKKPHIATVYPGRIIMNGESSSPDSGWANVGSFTIIGRPPIYRDLWHYISDADGNITRGAINREMRDGKWVKFDLDWNPTAGTNGTLYYTLNDQTKTIIDSQVLKEEVFNEGTVNNPNASKGPTKKAYFGFTGATGGNVAFQQLAFTRLGANIQTDVALTKDSTQQPVQENDTLSSNETVTVNVSAKWLSGELDYQKVLETITLPEGLSVVPNTTKVNGSALADDRWSGKNLTTKANDVPDVNSTNQNSVISFQAKVTATTDLQNQQVVAKISGSSGSYDPKSVNFSIKKADTSTIFALSKPQDFNVTGKLGQVFKVNLGKVEVTDTRPHTGPVSWKVELKLDAPFVTTPTNGQSVESGEKFFSYRNDGQISNITKAAAITLTDFVPDSGNTIYTLDQAKNGNYDNGFYINANSSLPQGTYSATLGWSLIDAP